jgi:hypothetical protein
LHLDPEPEAQGTKPTPEGPSLFTDVPRNTLGWSLLAIPNSKVGT